MQSGGDAVCGFRMHRQHTRAVEFRARDTSVNSRGKALSLGAGAFDNSPQSEVRVKLPLTLQPQPFKHVNLPRTTAQSAQVEAAW
jgi:hypothetical protein